jgi:hypothetical protein
MIPSNRFGNLLRIVLISFVSLVTACTPLNPQPEELSRLALKQVKPSIRGTITEVYQESGTPYNLYVTGIKENDTSYDKATVRVSDKTHIFLSQGNSYELTSVSQLTVGLTVEAVFTGLILERYPVSAEAEEILILEKAP